MKVLIYGGKSNLSESLIPEISKFAEVITAGRNNCDIKIDLKDDISTFVFPHGIDVIIHTAAHFGGISDHEILEAENINAIGTLKLCQAALKYDIKYFVYISSIYTLSDVVSDKNTIYSISKRHSEELAKYYCSLHRLPLVILRPSPIYGIGDKYSIHQPFFYKIIDSARKGEHVFIHGSNDPKRNFIYVDDLVIIISKVIQDRIEGVYQCTHTNNITFSEIAESAFSAFHTNGSVFFLTDKPNVDDNIFINDFSLYKKINYYPQISIQEGIRKISNDYNL